MQNWWGAISPWLHWAWSGFVAGLDNIRKSFVALVSSKAAWLAVLVVFVGGFWIGHIEGGAGKRDLRAKIAHMERYSSDAITDADARAKAASDQADVWKARAKAAEDAVGKAASGPVAAAPKRRVVSTRPKQNASSAPASSWNPFR
jgi:hypothetical protein